MVTEQQFNRELTGVLQPQVIQRHAGGRPRLTIDEKHIYQLCLLGCTIEEIAHALEVSKSYIDKRRATDPHFRELMDRGWARMRVSLRREQMRAVRQGNATMLVWLGKQSLGQRDFHDVQVHSTGSVDVNLNVATAREEITSRIARIAERAGQAAGH